MNMIRRALLAIALIANPAFGQSAPPAVPALPDTDRVQSYSISASTCACAVNFALYGDSTDYQNWLTVYVNKVQVAYNDPTFGWTVTSPTGPLSTIPRPISDAVLTFNAAVTGTIDIVGARRPRRVAQFAENRGVAARDLNQALTDIVAQNRETWDLWERAITFEPGFTQNTLPIAASRALKFLCFDGAGQPTVCTATTGTTTFSAGTGIAFSGTNPVTINTNLSAGTGIAITGTNPQTIARFPVAVRSATTANDTATSADCGTTIVATGGFNTLTLPASASVPVGCEIGYRNGDVYSGIGTGRGKKLVNFPADFLANNILYSGQVGKVINGATAWRTSVSPGPWLLPTSVELCVRQDGNDTSDGLGNGTVAADCLAKVQTAVLTIGKYWNGIGYNACSIGIYAGGTSIINESVSQTGQSQGCYLTVNIRGAITWTNSAMCWTTGDDAIMILNANLGFVPIFQCNTSNTALTGQFYGHQQVIYDINGSFEWIPGGANDDFIVMDAQGRATLGLTTMVVGDGNARAARSIMNCNFGCRGLQISGAVAFSPNMTLGQSYILHATSLINTTASYSGAPTVAAASTPTGNSVLITNGTTIPGGTSSNTGGQVCTSQC